MPALMLHPCYRTYQKIDFHSSCCVYARLFSPESICISKICRFVSWNFITHRLHPKSRFSNILTSQLPLPILTFPPFLERMSPSIFTVETQQPNSLANYKKEKRSGGLRPSDVVQMTPSVVTYFLPRKDIVLTRVWPLPKWCSSTTHIRLPNVSILTLHPNSIDVSSVST